MHESDEDRERLRRLLQDSYEHAGGHLAAVHSDRVRIDVGDLLARLEGMQVLVVATVSHDGRPFTGPVDGFVYRGRWHFGTSAESLRARHLARSPWISATHVRGEDLVVTVHGRARMLDLAGCDRLFAELMRAHYWTAWDEWGAGGPYYAIEADRMYAADMSRHRTTE